MLPILLTSFQVISRERVSQYGETRLHCVIGNLELNIFITFVLRKRVTQRRRSDMEKSMRRAWVSKPSRRVVDLSSATSCLRRQPSSHVIERRAERSQQSKHSRPAPRININTPSYIAYLPECLVCFEPTRAIRVSQTVCVCVSGRYFSSSLSPPQWFSGKI